MSYMRIPQIILIIIVLLGVSSSIENRYSYILIHHFIVAFSSIYRIHTLFCFQCLSVNLHDYSTHVSEFNSEKNTYMMASFNFSSPIPDRQENMDEREALLEEPSSPLFQMKKSPIRVSSSASLVPQEDINELAHTK